MAFIPNTVLGSLVDRQNKIKRQIGNVLVNSEYDNNIEKSMDDSIGMKKHGYHNQLEKGGEGSRGGKIIGHTSMGKPIYAKSELHSYQGGKDDATKTGKYNSTHSQSGSVHYIHPRTNDGKVDKSKVTGHFDEYSKRGEIYHEPMNTAEAKEHFSRQNSDYSSSRSAAKGADDSDLHDSIQRHESGEDKMHEQAYHAAKDELRDRGAGGTGSNYAKSKEDHMNKSIEVYTLDSINRFRDDLSKAFDNEEISEADFEKGMRDVNGLQKKIITNKLGHQQTVFVRVNKDESEHHFNHGDKVKFEHGGKQKTGVIKKLKDHPVTDKFGTAHIEDEQGNKYSKSLRAIEHHQDSDANQTHTPVATAATISEVEEDQGVKRYSESDQDKPKSREEEHAHHAALKSELKRVNPKLHASNWENHDLSTADASAMQVINKQLKHQIRQSGGNTDVQPEKKETKLVTQQSILDNKRGVGGLKDLADYSKQEQSLGKKAYDGVKHSISGTKTTERMESTSERPDMKKNKR